MKVREWLDAMYDRSAEAVSAPIYALLAWIDENFVDKVQEAVFGIIEDIETEAIKMASPLIDMVLENQAIPEPVRENLEGLKIQTAPIQLAVLIPFIGGMLVSVVLNAGAGLGEQIRQESYRLFRPALLSPGEAVVARWRKLIDSDYYENELAQHGYNAEKRELLEKINLYEPNASDLIQFSVRDVFNEDIVDKYGYDNGFDEAIGAIGDRLQAAGMDKETLRLFWRSHWQLPSITQAFEMLHRGHLREEDVKELLRIADVAPQFIEPVMKVAYAPYTRVDVRRMYDAGVLDRDAVKRSYQDLGYDEEHAENLTLWTELDSMVAERELTKTEILSSFDAGQMSENDARAGLAEMGYNSDNIDVILSLSVYKQEKKMRDAQKKAAVDSYYYGSIDIAQLTTQLDTLGLSEREKQIAITEVQNRILAKHRNPTKADYAKWWQSDLISESEYRNGLRALGYDDRAIELYVKAGGAD